MKSKYLLKLFAPIVAYAMLPTFAAALVARETLRVHAFAGIAILLTATANAQKFRCQPCIDRMDYKIQVIVHGTKTSDFWQRVHASAVQAGKDMNVDLQMELYDTFNKSMAAMADDIVAAAKGESPPDALVVSIPSDEVAAAVKTAIDAGVPVFGMNSGYDVADELGVLGFVAMDEYIGGREIAEAMLDSSARNITKALYINHEKGNLALDARRDGFADKLIEVNAETQVEDLIVDTSEGSNISTQVNAKLEGCPYDSILLASSVLFEYAKSASDLNQCNVTTKIGTFDANSHVFDAIASGDAVFGVSQQEYLQGALPIIMASVFATTGMRLALPIGIGDHGVYMSGPKVFTTDNAPSKKLQTCVVDSFPVCPNTQGTDGSLSECACTNRSSITIGLVLNDPVTEPFWDPVVTAATQAAKDMNIKLWYNQSDLEEFSEELFHEMASKIQTMCEAGVDGIVVAIPSETVVPSITSCLERKIPVVSINAGAETSQALGLMHHIGQLEFNAGLGAGHHLVSHSSQITKVFCLSHFSPSSSATARCSGFEHAISQHPSVTYVGMVELPHDSVHNGTLYKAVVEQAVAETGDWSNIGLLLLGKSQLPSALEMQAAHPSVKMGTFDVPPGLYAVLEEGTIGFGIDQQEYLQGYFPITLLTYMAYTNERLYNHEIETGPIFIDSVPSEEEQICEAKSYEVCNPIKPVPRVFSDANGVSRIKPYGMVALCLMSHLYGLFI